MEGAWLEASPDYKMTNFPISGVPAKVANGFSSATH
jgi:hypothetical protein